MLSTPPRFTLDMDTVINIKTEVEPILPQIPLPPRECGMLTCAFCFKVYKHQFSLNKHTRAVHTPFKYNCHLCSKAFKYSSSLTDHINIVHCHIRYPCPFCPKTYARKRNRSIHCQKIHTTSSVSDGSIQF